MAVLVLLKTFVSYQVRTPRVVCKERSALREKARPTHSLLTYYSEVSKWLEAIAKRARHDATAQRTSVRKHFKGRGVAGK